MDVLMSIKPQYVEKIISKEKTYEFRRSVFKRDVTNVIIYATAPEKKIIGSFELEDIIRDTPSNLWNNFSNKAGICKKPEEYPYSNYREQEFKVIEPQVEDEFIDIDEEK